MSDVVEIEPIVSPQPSQPCHLNQPITELVTRGIPTDWCLENVAKLLKLCGESVCFEVLGNKAMNGRVHELSYLGYYLGQVLGQDDIMHGRVKGLESFTSSIKQILTVIPSNKDQMALISSLFNVWEENILSLGEGLQEDLDIVTPEEQEQVFAASVHNLSKVAAILLKEHMVK